MPKKVNDSVLPTAKCGRPAKGSTLVYVPDEGIKSGDTILGIMFDAHRGMPKRFWLVAR